MTYPYIKNLNNNRTSLKSNFLCEVNGVRYSYRLSRHIQQPRGNRPCLTCAPKHIKTMLRFALTDERYGACIVREMKNGGGRARLALVYFDEANGYKVGVLCVFERRYGNTSEITLITMMDEPPLNRAFQPVLFMGEKRIELDAWELKNHMTGKPSIPPLSRSKSREKKEEAPVEFCQKMAPSEETSSKRRTWMGVLGVIFRRARKGLCRVVCG